LFISHDVAATRYISDRIAVMRQGEIVEMAARERFFGEPEHEYSRALLAAAL
jgi:ABC-type glutathione transport system ATPase component